METDKTMLDFDKNDGLLKAAATNSEQIVGSCEKCGEELLGGDSFRINKWDGSLTCFLCQMPDDDNL